jgi:hypothetical protein
MSAGRVPPPVPRGSPKQIALALRRRAIGLESVVREAEKQTAEEGLKLARFYSTGLFSLGRLREMGHPYAARRPAPPTQQVNYHKGRFYRGWKVRPPRKSGGTLTTKLVNDWMPVAGFLLGGTTKMIARPLLKLIRQKLKGKRQKLLTAALKRSRQG